MGAHEAWYSSRHESLELEVHLSDEPERASDAAYDFLAQYLLEHATRGVGRVPACQHVAPSADGTKVDVAFAVLDGYLDGEPEVEAAVRHCIDQVLTAKPSLRRYGPCWFTFKG